MLSVILGWIETLTQGHLTWLAWDIHTAALSAATFIAGLPLAIKAFSGLKVERETIWVSFWICPECNQLNRRSFVVCQRCEKAREISRFKEWIAALREEKMKPAAAALRTLLQSAGWIIFYGALGLAVVGFRLYDFNQPPLQELLGSLALIFLLLALLYYRGALRPALESPVTKLTDLIAAVTMTAFFLTAGLLWAAVPYRPHRPLATLQTLSPNQVQARVAGRRPTLARADSHGQNMTWSIEYAVLSWPLFDIRQIFLMQLSDQPLEDPWMRVLLERSAGGLQGAAGTRPRLVLLTQQLASVPGRSYELAEDPFGNGLVLTPQPPRPKTAK